MYHSDPIKYIFLESFWSGRVKYCIFDDDGPKYLGRGTKFSQWMANIWTIWTNQTYSTDGLFRAQYTFLVAGGGDNHQVEEETNQNIRYSLKEVKNLIDTESKLQ